MPANLRLLELLIVVDVRAIICSQVPGTDESLEWPVAVEGVSFRGRPEAQFINQAPFSRDLVRHV